MVWIGVDVGKRELEIAVYGGESRTVRQPEDLETAVDFIAEHRDARVVLESTGGYEKALFDALSQKGIATSVVNPAHAHAFKRSLGKIAKTDAIDARLLALMGETLKPAATTAPSAERRRLETLVARRSQLVRMLTAEANHAEHHKDPETQSSTIRVRAVLKGEVRLLDSAIKELTERVPEVQLASRVLQSVPGVGPTIAAGMLVHLPELGQADKREIAALAGLAPYNRDSGAKKGTRSIYAGRTAVRSLLYMAALVAARHNARFRQLYARLVSSGKPKKVALIAVARKLLVVLNAMVKHGQLWNHQPAPDPG
jgi:transposase